MSTEIIKFSNYSTDLKLNENLREAKDFLNAKINKGELAKEELTNPESPFNKIRKMLEQSNNLGYMGYFVRQFYNNAVSLDKLKVLLDYLLSMKKLNKPIDISKYNKVPFDTLMQELKSVVDVSKIGGEMPGLIVQEEDMFSDLADKIKSYPWYVIVCVKKKGDSWIADHDAELAWGSPRWCLKSPSHWSSYVGSNNLQYVIIHESFYADVIKASLEKNKSNIGLVPRNFDTNFARADSYNGTSWKQNSVKLRYGITTPPAESVLNFFQERDNNLVCFDDANGSVSTLSRLSDLTNGFPFRLVDVQVRKVLGLKRSAFDVNVPTFEEIVRYLDYKPTMSADDLIKICGNFVNIMDKAASSKEEEFEKIRKQVCPYLLKVLNEKPNDPKNIFWSIIYATLYASDVDDKVLDVLNDLFQVKNLGDPRLNMTVAISMLQIYLNLKDRKMKVDPKIDKFIEETVKNFFLANTLSSPIKDKPNSGIDFKRSMLHTFRANKLYTDLEGVNHNVTRAKLFRLMANYLYVYHKEYGEKIMKGDFFKPGEISWNDEIKFIEEISKKVKEDDTESNAFIDNVAISVLKRMPASLSDKIDGVKFEATMKDVFGKINDGTYDNFNYTYKVLNHNECLFTALKYYIDRINPDIKKELLPSAKK